MAEELHHPWRKRLLVGFARTSDTSGPGKPNSPHPLIQEIDSELPVSQPALRLTYDIFGSCPPMQPFDPAKMLTDSGKLQTLDILLKFLRAENHRVLLFAQMTKLLHILEVPRRFTSKVERKIGYEDFVYFILSKEDKSSEPGLKYWYTSVIT